MKTSKKKKSEKENSKQKLNSETIPNQRDCSFLFP